MADHLVEILAGLSARLIHNWDGEATQEFTGWLRALTRHQIQPTGPARRRGVLVSKWQNLPF